MNRTLQVNSLVTKSVQYAVLFYQSMAVLIFLIAFYLGVRWLSLPFLGGFFEHSMVLNGSNTTEGNAKWALYDLGYEFSDQLISINNQPVTNAAEMGDVLEQLKAGDSVSVL